MHRRLRGPTPTTPTPTAHPWPPQPGVVGHPSAQSVLMTCHRTVKERIMRRSSILLCLRRPLSWLIIAKSVDLCQYLESCVISLGTRLRYFAVDGRSGGPFGVNGARSAACGHPELRGLMDAGLAGFKTVSLSLTCNVAVGAVSIMRLVCARRPPRRGSRDVVSAPSRCQRPGL
jgi:hypothetical protein